MSHPQVTRPAISSSGGDWSRLPSFVSAPSLVLLAWTALQGATAQSLEFFSDATCANSIKKIDSVASLSCVDISDVGSFVGFTWGTDIGQIVFYNSDAAGGSVRSISCCSRSSVAEQVGGAAVYRWLS